MNLNVQRWTNPGHRTSILRVKMLSTNDGFVNSPQHSYKYYINDAIQFFNP